LTAPLSFVKLKSNKCSGDERVSRTFQDYLALCRRFQEQNDVEFDERIIVKPSGEKMYYSYNAAYRDDTNDKTSVEIRYDGWTITWDMEEGRDDPSDELNRLYVDMFGARRVARHTGNPADRVYKVLQQIVEGIQQAQAGVIGFAEVFNYVNIRDCLAQHTVLAATWHIDDIRDLFPMGTSDDELFQELMKMEAGLKETARRSGMDYIMNQQKETHSHQLRV
jgi:hypothetical protein